MDHLLVHKEAFLEVKCHKMAEYSDTLTCSLLRMPVETRRIIKRGKEMGMWITLAPSMVNGAKLSAQEFWDHLFL
jgi:hypothetical protein